MLALTDLKLSLSVCLSVCRSVSLSLSVSLCLSLSLSLPQSGLDMSPYVLGEAAAQISAESPPIYDLFGVINHYGTVCAGHYASVIRSPVGDGEGMQDIALCAKYLASLHCCIFLLQNGCTTTMKLRGETLNDKNQWLTTWLTFYFIEGERVGAEISQNIS